MSRLARTTLMIILGIGAAVTGAYFGWRGIEVSAASHTSATALFSQTFPDAAGTQHMLADYRGKIIVVNFWATWCTPCVEEIPELSRLQAEYGARNVQFVGIGIDNAANIAEFQKKVHADYPLLVAGANGSDLIRAFGDTAGALPYTLVLDRVGTVRATKLGKVDEAELRRWLAPLVSQ